MTLEAENHQNEGKLKKFWKKKRKDSKKLLGSLPSTN